MSKPPVSEFERTVARHVAAAFGGRPRVVEYHHEESSLSIDVLSVEGQPEEGLVSLCTIGLSTTTAARSKEGIPIGVEIVGVMRSDQELAANIIASAAFSVLRSGGGCVPGKILYDVVGDYGVDSAMKHIFLTDPYPWDNLETLDVQGRKVAWLLGVPISNSEAECQRDHGEGQLASLLQGRYRDLWDLQRLPVI